MSVIGSNILAGASGQGGDYTIARSLRFRSSASAFLSRTPASASNRTTWTWSGWVKRGTLGATNIIFEAGSSGTNDTTIYFNTSNQLEFFNRISSSVTGYLVTTQVFRDPSAWYHIVAVWNSGNATAASRMSLYINGAQITSFATQTNPSLNENSSTNNTVLHKIGATGAPTPSSGYLDGYMTETNFIDGQALTPSSFGENNEDTGVWQPKKYAGTYGTNGFYLPFSDNASTTTLGADSSGNGNNWTTNNISLTAGSTYDSMTDVPTLTSATAANFAVMNPLDQAGGLVFSEANLRVTAATGWDGARATFSLPSTGKYYWETTCISRATGAAVGILGTSAVIVGDTANAATGYVYNSGDGQKYNNGSASSYGATWGTNDIIGISWDADAGALVFYKNGTSQGTAWTGLSGIFSPAIGVNGSDSMNANFGQRPFAYTPPTGFVALNTFNLPTPTIGATASTQANKYFDINLYNGNSSTQAITNSGFQPSLVWVKGRNSATQNRLFNILSGVQKELYSNLTNAEATDVNGIQAFNSNGFTLGSNDANTSGTTYVGWQWNGGGTGVSNTAGSITSTVSANTSAGFSVVTYTAQSSGTATMGHGLGVAPAMIIVKSRTVSPSGWNVYHRSLGATKVIYLNSTDAESTSSGNWNNTAPTSTVFTGGTGFANGGNMVAYCFSAVQGYSAMGSYTGNGSTDGVFVYTGFRPKYVLIKNASASGNDWKVFDTARNTANPETLVLYPNLSNAEDTNTGIDFTANGFKLRDNGSSLNGSGNTMIYYAVAENPFKYSLGR